MRVFAAPRCAAGLVVPALTLLPLPFALGAGHPAVGEPQPVGGTAAHHPDVAALARSVQVATSPDDGKSWTEPRRVSAPGAEAAPPQIVGLAARTFLVAWTERTGDGVIARRSAVIDAHAPGRHKP